MSNIGSINFASNNYNLPSVNTERAHVSTPQQENVAVGDSVSLNSGSDSIEKTKKKWTVLLYSAADNNLETALVKDVAELESVGSSNEMNLVAQLDRGDRPSSISGGWDGCKRFYLTKDDDRSNINSPALADLGQVNMSDPKVLSDFIQWGMKEFPAENYILIMSDHGAGWPGALQDISHNDFASTPSLKDGIMDAEKKTGQKINIIGFDACLMASTEVAHELSNAGDFLVASQNTEGGDGWPYSKIFSDKVASKMQQALSSKLDVDPREVAKAMVNESEGFPSISTLAAMDLAKMPELTQASDKFAQTMMNSGLTADDKAEIKKLINQTKSWYGFKDQYQFAEKLVNDPAIKNDDLKAAAKEMMASINNVIIAEQHSSAHNGAHGLSIEMNNAQVSKPTYGDLQFAKDTKWDEAIKWLNK